MHASKETKLRSAQHKAHSEAKERRREQRFADWLLPTPTPMGWGVCLHRVKTERRSEASDGRHMHESTGKARTFRGNTTLSGVLPRASEGKQSACNAGDPSLIPASGRSPREGNGYPLQYCCLENSMDRGARWAIVRAGLKESGQDWVTNPFTLFFILSWSLMSGHVCWVVYHLTC